jgi:hypothetical protein
LGRDEGEFPKFGGDLLDHGGPISRSRLAEQADGGTPGAVVAIQEPPAIWRVGERYPDRLAQSSGILRDGGVHGDQQVEIGESRCRPEASAEEIFSVRRLDDFGESTSMGSLLRFESNRLTKNLVACGVND